MNFVFRKKLICGLAILLCFAFYLSGCSYLSRFEPNTMVKEFVVEGDNPMAGDYKTSILMQAKELGNKAGINDYRIVFELKSIPAINTAEDSLALPIPRITSVTITAAANKQFRINLTGEQLENRELNTPPQVFRSHYIEYFDVREVEIPDEIDRIKLEAAIEFYDRQSHESSERTQFSAVLNKRQSIEWFNPKKFQPTNESNELELYRGSNADD